MVYPDIETLLALLTNGQHSERASSILRETSGLTIGIVHRLQVENSLVRFLHDPRLDSRVAAKQAVLMWQHYIEEQVFAIREFDLSAACLRAAVWNTEYKVQPPRWHILLHVAIAAGARATFLSFEPLARERAAEVGLTIIPQSL